MCCELTVSLGFLAVLIRGEGLGMALETVKEVDAVILFSDGPGLSCLL